MLTIVPEKNTVAVAGVNSSATIFQKRVKIQWKQREKRRRYERGGNKGVNLQWIVL